MGEPRNGPLPGDAVAGPREALQRLGQVLQRCAADRLTGTVRVTGTPGGTIHQLDGGITGIDTPGAPGPEVMLLRSGRVPEPAWAAAYSVAAPADRLGAELVHRQLVGAGELQVLLKLAVADAMFALATGEPGECVPASAPGSCLLPLEPPAEPGWLEAETSRRLGVLASLSQPVDHGRDRWQTAGNGPAVGLRLGGGRDELLALANGRRTARDIAFALGRGVYAVTLELAAMHAEGLLVPSAPRMAATVPRPAPAPAPASAGNSEPSAPLPRRRRAPGQSSRARAAGSQADRAALLRLLRAGQGDDGGG
jgi:hypothetical protein